MNNNWHERKHVYLKQKELYSQMMLESKIGELTHSLDTYQVTDSTEFSTLEAEILPLKHRLDTLLKQLVTLKEQTLYAPHYSEIEFEKIEINNIPAFFTSNRIDIDSLPQGYRAYDIRSSANKELAIIEPFVGMDYYGTILVEQLAELNEGRTVVDSYHFSGEVVAGYSLIQINNGFQKLVNVFELRLQKYFDRIDKISQDRDSRNEAIMPKSPRYLQEVIMPVYQGIAEFMYKRNIQVTIPDPNTYRPITNHFRIKVGGKTVGGFSVPDGDDHTVYFTPFKRVSPIGEKTKIKDSEQLCQLILALLGIAE